MKNGVFMTLLKCNPGETHAVEAICLGSALSHRLQMLGLTKGTDVTVMRKKRGGTMIIKVRGVRYAIGRSCAEGIFVGEADHECK